MMTSPCTRTRRQLIRPLLLALAPVVLIMIATGVVRWTSLGIDLPTPVWLFILSKLVILTVVAWRFAWQWYRQDATRHYGEPGAR
jgi:hypothetical protein